MEYIRQAEEAWLNRGGEWMIYQGEPVNHQTCIKPHM